MSEARSTETPARAAPRPDIAGLRAMAVVRWLLLVAVAAAAASTWWLYVLRGETEVVGQARFYCPMHPRITSPAPGTCPICSMRLEPIPASSAGAGAAPHGAGGDRREARSADAGPAEAALAEAGPDPAQAGHGAPEGLVPVMLTTERQQLAGIASVPARRAAAAETLRLPATVAAREGALSEVRMRVGAFVERAQVRESGVRVRAGQVLAHVFAPEIVQAQQELLAALRWRGEPGSGGDRSGGEPLAQAARERLEYLGLDPRDVEAIVASGRVARAVPVRAPAAGWVIERRAVPGAFVDPNQPLYVVADLSRVWVVASAFDAQLEALAPGRSARFVPRHGEPIDVVLERVLPAIESATRTAQVRFVADNPALALFPGAIGEVVLERPRTEHLLVPRDAVIDTGQARYVFVDRGDGSFEPRPVQLGPLLGEERAIVRGLEQGERVVARGTFVLDAESRLSAALAPRPVPAPPAPPAHGSEPTP